jgi:hypothetical protein
VDPTRGDAPLQLVFSGECLDGHDPQAVRQAIAGALKLDPKRAARLFSGKPIVLRRGVDVVTAQRQIARFAQLGAVLRTEPSKPRRRRADPARTKAPAGASGGPRRRPRLWIFTGVTLGLVLAIGLGLNALWSDIDGSGASSAPGASREPAPSRTAGEVPAATVLAEHEISKDMTAEAVREYKLRYLAAPKHKAFAISSRGAHAWHAGAALENEAREAALAGCMQAQPPSEDGCRVVDANGNWEE